MKYILLLSLFLNFLSISAQDQLKTAVSASKLIAEITQSDIGLSHEFPVSDSETVNLSWSERITSLTKEGVQSFVGYLENDLIGVLSIYNGKISAEVKINGIEFKVFTSDDDYLVIQKTTQRDKNCCICKNCSKNNETVDFNLKTQTPLSLTKTEQPTIPFDKLKPNVLRVYRLALVITYRAFDEYFNQQKESVQVFLANTEAFLNEIYLRDIGIKFELVLDDKFILADKSTDLFDGISNTMQVMARSTRFFQETRPDNAYDLGLIISYFDDASGMAAIRSAYSYYLRTDAVSIPNQSVIAHEIGHMFGADHTFTVGGSGNSGVEPYRGASLMSYGPNSSRNFFHLINRDEILSNLLVTSYYTDQERTNLVNLGNTFGYDNHALGIESENQKPVIDRTRLKSKYTIPEETFFGLNVAATDPDSHKLLYTMHQIDKKGGGTPALFRAFPPAEQSCITFQPKYIVDKHYNTLPQYTYTSPAPAGSYNFLLGVSDGGDKSEQHYTLYDTEKITVQVKEGLPFKIISPKMQGEYEGGETIELKWSVDKTIFPENSKVRILLSDDFGQSFKYTLVDNAPNNGVCNVKLPNIEVGKITMKEAIDAGVIKIEVIDHIAYAITEYDPNKNGFRIKANLETSLQQSHSPRVTIHPNPSRGQFKLNLSLDSPQSVKYSIYDILGKLIQEETIQVFKQQHEIDLDIRSKSGIYMLVVKTANKTITQKLIIRK